MLAAGEVSFYNDLVCPYPYMESHVIEQAQDTKQIKVPVRGDHLRVDWTCHVG